MSNGNNHQGSKRIGELLVEEKIVPENILQLALNKQVELAKKGFQLRIGEILIGAGVTERRTIINFLAKRGVKLRLGEILFLLGMLNEVQYKNIQKILVENTRNGISKSIGDIAIELGYIEQNTFYDFLEQSGVRLRVGEQLVKENIISQKMLHMILEEQKNNPAYQGKKLLDILLSMRIITQQQHDKYSGKLWDSGGIDFTFE